MDVLVIINFFFFGKLIKVTGASRLLIKAVVACMSIDEMLIDIWFLSRV